MHDTHAKADVGLAHDVHEHGATSSGGASAWGIDKAHNIETSTHKHNQDEVIT